MNFQSKIRVRISSCGVLGLFTLFTFIIIGCKPKEKETEAVKTIPPNILFFILDDAGWNDVGYNGSEINTPNIDQLAKDGVILNRFYVAPTCSPTRAALLTGMPASRLGILAPISGKSEKTLPSDLITLPMALSKRGYETALFGKWHLGLKPENGPQTYGFDYSYGFLHGQIDQYSHEYKNGDASWHRNGQFINEEGHATDLIGTETIEWLRKQRDTNKPFFAQVAYSAPHFPLQEPVEWINQYSDIKNESRRKFAAAMGHVDDDIGKVMKFLKTSELLETTMILFMSDNGGMKSWYPNTQYNGKHGPNDVLGDNTPLRDYKASNYEGGIRVPAILYWKGKWQAKVSNDLISVTDVMPSILQLAKVEIPTSVEGQPVFDFIAKGKAFENEIYIRGHKQQSLIKGDWKLVHTPFGDQEGNYELYHIVKDPEEKQEVSSQNSEITREYIQILNQHILKDSNEP
ncbi:sulfatase-like hydrolase/transferase [Euzebyella saccharophila]|uniref:Sulfatase-like hydrolase/transferase n=1 Tax=Euzebyella saccharophila TaxID=679664 RepID=A0ABV8JMI5_9FLAO|nr:sulfatase-like hydrolase/transferase [Euzebyella saccharophila]